MNIKEFYEVVGGSCDEVLNRLPDMNMVKKFLHKFAGDPFYACLMHAVENEDAEGAFRAAHTLKGTAANLGLKGLYIAASELTEQLRGKDELAETEYTEAVSREYNVVMDALGELE